MEMKRDTPHHSLHTPFSQAKIADIAFLAYFSSGNHWFKDPNTQMWAGWGHSLSDLCSALSVPKQPSAACSRATPPQDSHLLSPA